MIARGKVTVFGGTGFLGRRVVRHLLECEWSIRVASRHPERAVAFFPDVRLGIESIHAEINDGHSVAAALAAVEGVVNAVSLYVENGQHTFRSVHVAAAARVARLAREAGVEQLIHVSGIGSDARSASPYIRSRGEGERVVREEFPAATLICPSVMFGRGDAFLTPVARMLQRLPIFPLFGRGQTRLQPVHVEDVAAAITRAMQSTPSGTCYELGGPAHLRLQIAARNDSKASRQKAASGPHAVQSLARARLCRRDAARAAHHPKSGRAHAER